jgi:hypothetical protein
MTLVARPTQQISFSRKGLLWVFAILLGVSVISLPQYLRIKKSAGWPSVPGVVTASTMLSGLCRSAPCYRGQIDYQYRVADANYHGSALSLARTHWAVRDSWQRVLDRYPVGRDVRVYYEPRHPANAVLEPGLVGDTYLLYKMVLGMIWFFGFGFLAVLLWYRDPQPSVAELQWNSRKSL